MGDTTYQVTANPADLRDKAGRVTAKSLLAGDTKHREIGNLHIEIFANYIGEFCVSSYGDGIMRQATSRFFGVRKARTEFANRCRIALAAKS